MPRILTLIFFLFLSCSVMAQSWEVGANVGGAGYMGDLNPDNPIKVSGVSGGAYVKYNFNPYLSAKINYTYANITADDSRSNSQQFRDRNLSFSTNLNELALIGEFNFMDYVPSVSHNIYTPFIYAGVGMVGYNPRATYQGQTYDLRSLTTEAQLAPYATSAWSVPYGVGIKYNISGRVNLIADIGYRYALTDYLDDVSGTYPNKNIFSNPVSKALSDRSGEKTNIYIGTAGTQRGDMRKYDTYFFVGFSISYTFITQKCYY